jgi:hydroxymethylglutaryl-CoA lyase
MKGILPEKVQMLELLLRDGSQHSPMVIPVETKLWFADQFIRAGYRMIEVTNFAHPRFMPQHRDAEDILKRVSELESVKKNNVYLKCYGMTRRAFERAAECAQKGYPPHSVAFTISAEDLHGRRNSGRTREEYFEEIPDLVRIAKENGFEIDMAMACVYGSPCAGPVPIENTIELIERGLDLGIRRFTPCDTTGESNPLRAYEYMSALVDRFGKYDDETAFRVAHFHDARGMALPNYVASILGGARIIEASLGQCGGQPACVVDGVPGVGTGPLYTNSDIVGNASTEDVVVMLDEMGIDVGLDIDRVLQLGRVLEWVLGQSLRPYCTKSGRPIKQPVEWNIPERNLAYIPPYGPPEVYWADPSRYKPASASFIAKEFEGRKLRWDPWEDKVKGVKEE